MHSAHLHLLLISINVRIEEPSVKTWKNKIKVLAHRVWHLRMRFAVFFFFVFVMLSSQNACYGCENAENRTWSTLFLCRTKVSEAVCKRDWHNVRSYLFFNVQEFRTQCAKTLTSVTYTWPWSTKPKSLGYICSNSQKYIECVKIINFSFMPNIIRILRLHEDIL